jgi:hypothetical protein
MKTLNHQLKLGDAPNLPLNSDPACIASRSQHFAISASLIVLVQAWPLSFVR